MCSALNFPHYTLCCPEIELHILCKQKWTPEVWDTKRRMLKEVKQGQVWLVLPVCCFCSKVGSLSFSTCGFISALGPTATQGEEDFYMFSSSGGKFTSSKISFPPMTTFKNHKDFKSSDPSSLIILGLASAFFFFCLCYWCKCMHIDTEWQEGKW